MSKTSIFCCDRCRHLFNSERGLLEFHGLHFCTRDCFERYARDTWDAYVEDGDLDPQLQNRFATFGFGGGSVLVDEEQQRILAEQAESAAASEMAAEALEEWEASRG